MDDRRGRPRSCCSVACFNVANLMLVRADARQRELAVREALGAGRARVLAHFSAESVVLSPRPWSWVLFVAWLCVRALVVTEHRAMPSPFALSEVTIDGAALMFAIVVAAIVALVCSVVPSLRIGRVRLSNALREGGRTGTATRVQQRVRGTLVAAQIALALIVLSASGVLLRTFQQLRAVKPGFDAENVATFWIVASGRAIQGRKRGRAVLFDADRARHGPAGCSRGRHNVARASRESRHESGSALSGKRSELREKNSAAPTVRYRRQRLLRRDGHSTPRGSYVPQPHGRSPSAR
jgi:hypothetical protein